MFLVSLGLGQKGWGGNQLSAKNQLMAHRQGMFPWLLDAEGSGLRGRQQCWWKRSDLFRAELAEWKPCAPLGRRSTGCPLAVAV